MPDKIAFTEAGDFAACRAAERWCRERGISVGRMQGPAPRGLLFGDHYDIQKWRNLRPDERAALDGVMTGSMRAGPVYVELYRPAPDIRPRLSLMLEEEASAGVR